MMKAVTQLRSYAVTQLRSYAVTQLRRLAGISVLLYKHAYCTADQSCKHCIPTESQSFYLQHFCSTNAFVQLIFDAGPKLIMYEQRFPP